MEKQFVCPPGGCLFLVRLPEDQGTIRVLNDMKLGRWVLFRVSMRSERVSREAGVSNRSRSDPLNRRLQVADLAQGQGYCFLLVRRGPPSFISPEPLCLVV